MKKPARPEQTWLPWDRQGELDRRAEALRQAIAARDTAGEAAVDGAEFLLRQMVGGQELAHRIRWEGYHGESLPADEEPGP